MQIEEKLQHDKDLIPGILKLVELLDKYKNYSNIEIEIRLGYIQEKYFDSNITNEYYKKINNTLNSFEDWSYNDNKTTTDYYDGNLRLSIDMEGNRSAMKKVRLTDIDIVYDSGPFDIRISVSQETPIDPNDVNNNNLKTSRNKTRITRIYDKWKFDLSEVTTENNNLKKKSYEFEIEIDNPFDTLKKYNNDSVYVAHSTLLKLRQVINMCEEPDDEDIISMEIISENFRNHPI
tara:strand:+ start:117 stop:818 length:702 start_codon:yes stop_codon:yes gene_type:complete